MHVVRWSKWSRNATQRKPVTTRLRQISRHGWTAYRGSGSTGWSFLYNAIFFTEALVLTTFFKVPAGSVPLYLFPFAIGNLVGPWMLGRLFDVVGRRIMIAGTYLISGLLLIGTGILFVNGMLSALTVTLCWSVIFFFASAGASSAYLTASEIFPMETRAMAIAFVYAVGRLAGGAAAPVFFGALIASQPAVNVFYGYLFGAALMIVGGTVEYFFGVDAERKSLEEVAAPLSQIARARLAAARPVRAAVSP